MSEEQIIQAIANVCRDNTIHFQIIVQDNTLHVYINRQTDLDYQLITQQIYAAVASIKSLSFQDIYLYSRLLGEIEPDWQTYLILKEPSDAVLDSINYLATEITVEIEDTNALVEDLKYQTKAESLVENIVDLVEITGSLVSKLKKQLATKTFDSLAKEFGEDSTGEILAEVNHQKNTINNIDRIETASETQIFLGIMLIETAIINHNKALLYFCLSQK